MPGYNRFVSYLYNYEKQVKSDNVGYARVETRNGQCKITIHLKVINLKVNTIPIYVCIRKKGRLQGIPLGDITINRGIGEMQISTEEENIMESGLPLSSMVCMVVYYSDDIFYATEWDDEPVSIRGFKQYEKAMEQNEKSKVEALAQSEVIRSLPEEIKEEPEESEIIIKSEIEEELGQPVNMEELTQKVTEEMIEVIPEHAAEDTEDEIAEIPVKITEEIPEEREEKISGIKPNAAEKIFAKCPAIQPFEEGKVIACVKFQPEEIGLLPMEYWSLGNNSFLMHGYFNYRHLIFAKRTDGNKITYLLGVPGIQEKTEESLAAMFGFKYFFPLKRQVKEQRELGYWYMPINL